VNEEVIENVIAFARENGFCIHALEYSPIKGPEGNIEYLVYIEKTDEKEKEDSVDVHAVVEAAHGELD
jgi:23S rRNA (cytidine1920-2'-O)/16S rRNA (cytidine1409-2'-O)-methyltransferase